MHDAFKVHMLTDAGKARAQRLSQAFDALLEKTIEIMREGEKPNPPDRRYEGLVAVRLEEACFFAKKGMAIVSAEET